MSSTSASMLLERYRFLTELDAAMQPLVDPAQVLALSARMLAEHLGVERCAYASIDDERIFDITGDYARGVASVVGRVEVSAFGPSCVEAMLANRPYVVLDSLSDPRIGAADLPAYQAMSIRAVVCVPLHKAGKFTAAMAVHQIVPRVWTSDEVELVGLVAQRCWETLERARVHRTRSAAEDALMRSKARLDLTVKLSGVGFWYCDLPFDVLEWDERVKQHFWLPSDATVTIETFYERIHPEDRELTRAAIAASISNRGAYDVVYRTVEPVTGALKHIRALGGTIYGTDDAPLQFNGVTVDVTAQKRDQERLAQIADELREQDRRKDEFIATLAHELRNPLAPIRTGLHLLSLGTDAAAAQRTREMMARQLGHLVRMVDDLLDISRVTLDKVTLLKERIDFRAVLDSALETSRPIVEANRHELSIRLAGDTLPLEADATRLAQVVSNLVNNAAKYTPPGGRISLTAEPARDGRTLEIAVSDTGIGIPAEMLPRVFDMFTQIGQTIDRSQGGLGIGLTLVRRLVEMHDGTVEARSAGPGMGSTFVVRIPMLAREITARHRSMPSTVPSTALRILVVDDNLDGAESLAMLLEMTGHEIRLAHTGPEAVAAAADFVPQVVLLDIGLPGYDGYEVARRLRADQTRAQPFLIALTGWGSDEDKQRAKEAGFDRHMVKPVDAAKLGELLASIPRA